MPHADNRKALYDYEILEKYQAGLVLTGQETKSIKAGHMSLKGSHVTFHDGEAFLFNANISKYPQAGTLPDYDPTHSRKLLMKKKEIRYLQGKLQEKGLTIIPLSVYTNKRFVKIEIAVARGKKQYDKRETIKQRDTQREARQAMKFSN